MLIDILGTPFSPIRWIYILILGGSTFSSASKTAGSHSLGLEKYSVEASAAQISWAHLIPLSGSGQWQCLKLAHMIHGFLSSTEYSGCP